MSEYQCYEFVALDEPLTRKAIRLTIDLRDLAQRARRSTKFEARLNELRKRHPRRRGYLDEVKRRLTG